MVTLHSDSLNVFLRDLQMLTMNPMKKNLAVETGREKGKGWCQG